MIDRTHPLSITRQARALGVSRGSVYYVPRPVADADLALMRRLDTLHLDFPYAGARLLRRLLQRAGVAVGRRHVPDPHAPHGHHGDRPRSPVPVADTAPIPCFPTCSVTARSRAPTRCGRWISRISPWRAASSSWRP